MHALVKEKAEPGIWLRGHPRTGTAVTTTS